MAEIGFSTGALANGNFARAVAAAVAAGVRVIELSALRTTELPLLEEFVRHADLSLFHFVSVHAPADFTAEEEPDVVQRLGRIIENRPWPIVVHPDRIYDYTLWRSFGNQLCVENMDRRKTIGRYFMDLEVIFARLPEARFCLDVAHAKQVDPTMTECYRMLRSYRNRLCHLHLSDVPTSSKHGALSLSTLVAFGSLAASLPRDVPVILETPVEPSEAREQVKRAEVIFGGRQMDAAPTDNVGDM